MITVLATMEEAGLNANGVLWTAALVCFVGVCVYVARRQQTGRQPVNAVVAIVGGAALLTFLLGLAGLAVGAVVFGLYELARLASR
ncbi:MAG TPA: hypothetical protein VMA83_02855 [Solirubrobacteraceae bacterium]|nr:hypothetical protein [Solirubrobacteraceae bacterium]